MRSAASIVLSGELLVVLFAALVARALSGVDGWTILVVSLVVVVLIVAVRETEPAHPPRRSSRRRCSPRRTGSR